MTQPVAGSVVSAEEQLHWEPVLAHLSWLREDDPPVGRFVESTLQDDGSWSWPYEELSSRSEELVDDLWSAGIVADGVDWTRWLDARGDALLLDRHGEEIAAASLADCRRMLVTLVRQSRFVDGAMLTALRAGRVRWVLERIAVLTGQGEPA